MPARAALVVATFTVVMAGPNLPTPLLPGYRHTLGLGGLGLTVLFSTYLFALVATLLAARVPAAHSSPRALLLAGLVLAVASDAVLALPVTLTGVLVGRVLSGLSVGLATGAVAALLRRHGTPRAGSLTAFCALVGSAGGTALTAVLAEILPAAAGRSGYVAHAVLAVVGGIAVATTPALVDPARADTGTGAGPLVTAGRGGRFTCACGVGVCAWVTAGIVVALLPTYATALTGTTDLVVTASGVVGFLLAASASSVAAGRASPTTELALAPAAMAVGLVVVAVAGPVAAGARVLGTVLLVTGAVVAGAGMGLGFRAGLGAALAAAAPTRPGTATSLYSAAAYLGAALTTLLLGLLSGVTGLGAAVAVAAAAVVVGATVLVTGVRRAFAPDPVAPGRVRPPTLATPPGPSR